MGKRIMVVDDSRVVHLQMKKLLEGTEYEVVACCRDGEEAIDQYDSFLPDLTTMDIIMPGIDGLETARTILEEHPGANIVMLSSRPTPIRSTRRRRSARRGLSTSPLSGNKF